MNVFVARQPIFDEKKNVHAYELLFRSGIANFYDESLDGDHSTSKVISNSLLVIGMDSLTKGKRAFINFTRNLLVKGAPSVIPKDLVTVEILETVEPDEEVVAACRKLKQSGYVLALDDFVFEEKYRPLIDLADIIKVDFKLTTGDERKHVIEECHNSDIKFLAEKVENIEEFQQAQDLGYSYFQGYFFSAPDVVSGKDIPSNKLNYLRVLNEVNKPDVDFEKVEDIIRRDIALSYKLLRFMNSAFFNFTVKVESIRHALVLLGVREVKKWINIVALSGMGYDKPQELLVLSLIRARFCEFLANSMGMEKRNADFFMMGLFSVIDGLVDRPMQEILSELPILDDIKGALLGDENIFNDVFNLVLAYEKGDWDTTASCAGKLQVAEEGLPDFFLDSVKWANMAL